MRRLLLILAFLGALFVYNPPAADATPPGYFYLASGSSVTLTFQGGGYSCTARMYHGNFGNVAYSRVDLLGGNCSTWSGTKVQAWGDESQWCYYLAGTHGDCSVPETGTIQAVAVGTLIGSGFTICMGPNIYPPCATIWFSPIP